MRSASWPPMPWRRFKLEQVPVLGLQHFGHALTLCLALLLWIVDQHGQLKPSQSLNWLDIMSEGLTAVMLAIWLIQVRSSRPAGQVSDLLCLGLAAMLLGGWVDVLDEFWRLPKAPHWCHFLESGLGLLGVLLLTWGLQGWRQEQRTLNEQWRRRERLFREHRSLDGVTQLAGASYMAAQITLERQRGRRGQLLMLGWQGFEQLARRHGLAEAERMLQAAGQLLLLNLRPDDLLCRYGSDRFVILLPDCDSALGAELASDLRQALAAFAHASADGQARYKLPVLAAQAGCDEALPPEALLLQLLERLRP
ncbi:diguanylate cyclase [Paucibacter sp. APW11]|uniref:diguanylate cyclase n=1 Tax=Roseateles aquae TaxID=3077235 RepID=A0ABU3PEK6_9BURK|nr:diguanylate cyclase [Paucibacter sp. APW11]MDT9001037.1 diguanylate cyclase [Paucibacter sp. APW11]